MAEDLQNKGQQLQARLEKLADQWSQGRVTLKQIVGLSDEELYAVAQQGYYLFLQGKTEEARVIFEGLVAIDPKNAYYYRALGAIYWRLGKPQRAVKQFTYALRVAPKEISSHVNRAEVYVAEKNFGAARKDLNDALANGGKNDGPLLMKARAMLAMIT